MAIQNATTEAGLLEKFRVSLENAEKQPEIAAILAEYSLDTEALAEGRAKLVNAIAAYNTNKTEDVETSETRNTFHQLSEQLEASHRKHRKIARIVFRNDPVTRQKLAIEGAYPESYAKWIGNTKTFYAAALGDETIQTALGRLKVTPEELTATSDLAGQVEAARAEYHREIGESQNATKVKDAALSDIEDWMSEFYAISRIALEDNPQLLESLGVFVRS